LHVFGSSDTAVAADEIADTVDEAWYGDEPPQVERPGDGWSRLTIELPEAGRPIVLHRDIGGASVTTMVDEQLAEHPDLPAAVADRLRRTSQVISLEIFPETVDDDGWELLDVLQSVLARRIDGLVVTDDGVYDERLQRLGP
jgi:hypothetical protein